MMEAQLEQQEELQKSNGQIRNNTITSISNTNTKKIHYPSCKSVSQMSEKNKQEYKGDKSVLEAQGYELCQRCNP
mgnify:CR=1 FL=1